MRLYFLPLFICATLFGLHRIQAHPVAQGSMEVTLFPDRIEILAHVSAEEIQVDESYGPNRDNPSSSEDRNRAHGEYLLNHIILKADGRALKGELRSAQADSREKAEPGSMEYLFSYPALDLMPITHLELRQNVFNEFEFEPGNRWEATYFVRFATVGGIQDAGQLLTSLDPIRYKIDAASTPQSAQLHLVWDYFKHGVMHILTGYDHLLFITALVLAVRSFWELVKVLTAFTLAHTVTLTLSVLDLVRLPERIVEPMIAASIVFVAVQNVVSPARTHGTGRLLIAFFFGLFHGLGYAGGLLDTMRGMSGLGIGLSIGSFSLGVEVGHLAVVTLLFVVLKILRAIQREPEKRDLVSGMAMRYGSILISVAGVYYFILAVR